jgi:hypothetical protein
MSQGQGDVTSNFDWQSFMQQAVVVDDKEQQNARAWPGIVPGTCSDPNRRKMFKSQYLFYIFLPW